MSVRSEEPSRAVGEAEFTVLSVGVKFGEGFGPLCLTPGIDEVLNYWHSFGWMDRYEFRGHQLDLLAGHSLSCLASY